jgi:hypothetical protein
VEEDEEEENEDEEEDAVSFVLLVTKTRCSYTLLITLYVVGQKEPEDVNPGRSSK